MITWKIKMKSMKTWEMAQNMEHIKEHWTMNKMITWKHMHEQNKKMKNDTKHGTQKKTLNNE